MSKEHHSAVSCRVKRIHSKYNVHEHGRNRALENELLGNHEVIVACAKAGNFDAHFLRTSGGGDSPARYLHSVHLRGADLHTRLNHDI